MIDAKISAYDVLEELAGNRLKPLNHVRDLKVIMAFGAQRFDAGKQAAEKNSRGFDSEPGLTDDQIRAAVERGNREVLEGRGYEPVQPPEGACTKCRTLHAGWQNERCTEMYDRQRGRHD